MTSVRLFKSRIASYLIQCFIALFSLQSMAKESNLSIGSHLDFKKAASELAKAVLLVHNNCKQAPPIKESNDSIYDIAVKLLPEDKLNYFEVAMLAAYLRTIEPKIETKGFVWGVCGFWYYDDSNATMGRVLLYIGYHLDDLHTVKINPALSYRMLWVKEGSRESYFSDRNTWELENKDILIDFKNKDLGPQIFHTDGVWVKLADYKKDHEKRTGVKVGSDLPMALGPGVTAEQLAARTEEYMPKTIEIYKKIVGNKARVYPIERPE